jgi:hypothetical protein
VEDWGGKPFVDMIAGWKYALEKFPEVKFVNLLMKELILSPTRSIQIGLLLLAQVGVDMLSSTCLTLDTVPLCPDVHLQLDPRSS